MLAEFAPHLSIGLSLSTELCRMASSGCREGWEMVTSAGLLFVRKKGKQVAVLPTSIGSAPGTILSPFHVVTH